MAFGVGEALAIGSIASSLIGGGISAAGASNANKRGYRLAHEQMDWQEKQVQKQREYNEDMYNRYYSIQAQANQYRAAGMNPLLANIQSQQMAQSGLPAGVDMPEQQNTGAALGSAIGNSMSQVSNTLTQQSQRELNESAKGLSDASSALKDAQTELTKSQNAETQERVNALRLDVLLAQATYDYKVKQEFWRANLLNWQNNDLEIDYRRKVFSLYNIDEQQSEVLRQQSLNVAADTAIKFWQGKYTMQEALNYMNEFALRQYEAKSGRINANAAAMNAATTRSLMPHLAKMYDSSAEMYSQNARAQRNQNDAFDLEVNHNGKLIKSGFALQYTLVNQNRAALTYALKTPDLLKSMQFNNYAQGISSGLHGIADVTKAVGGIVTKGVSGAVDTVTDAVTERVTERYDKDGAFSGSTVTRGKKNLQYKRKHK